MLTLTFLWLMVKDGGGPALVVITINKTSWLPGRGLKTEGQQLK